METSFVGIFIIFDKLQKSFKRNRRNQLGDISYFIVSIDFSTNSSPHTFLEKARQNRLDKKLLRNI